MRVNRPKERRQSITRPTTHPWPVRLSQQAPAFGAITVQLPQDRQSLGRRVVECKRRPLNATVQILETKTWRVAMRGVAVPYAVLAAVLVLNAAVAQNDPGQPLPSSPSAQTTGQADNNIGQAVWQAPIGHR